MTTLLIRRTHTARDLWYLQSEQMAALHKRWAQTKADAEREHGTAEHLELPDIIIRHEMSYEAPPGKANADRPMPLPRALVRRCLRNRYFVLVFVSCGRRYTSQISQSSLVWISPAVAFYAETDTHPPLLFSRKILSTACNFLLALT